MFYNGHCSCLATICFVSFYSYSYFCLNSHTSLVIWFKLGSALANKHDFISWLQFFIQMNQIQTERDKMRLMWKIFPNSLEGGLGTAIPQPLLLKLMCSWWAYLMSLRMNESYVEAWHFGRQRRERITSGPSLLMSLGCWKKPTLKLILTLDFSVMWIILWTDFSATCNWKQLNVTPHFII